MARGRVITPEFWTDEKVIALSPLARLFYIGCWNFSYCDRGHLPNSAFELRLKIFPGDPVNGQELVDELISQGKLIHISADGQDFLQMESFEKHQTKDKRWKNSRCPACALLYSNDLSEPQATSMEVASAPTSATDHSLERRGEERREEDKEPLSSAVADDQILIPDSWQPNQKHRDKAMQLSLDIDRELSRFTDHARRTMRRQKNWNTAFTNWLRKAVEFRQQSGHQLLPQPTAAERNLAEYRARFGGAVDEPAGNVAALDPGITG